MPAVHRVRHLGGVTVQSRWARLLLAIAGAKVFLGLAGVPGSITARIGPGGVSGAAVSALFLVLLLAALALFTGGRRDRRALVFGVWFLLAAAPFADTLAGLLAESVTNLEARYLLALLLRIQVDAFLPFALWVFVSEFPRVRTFRTSRTLRLFRGLSLGVGVVLAAINLALFLLPALDSWTPLTLLDRTRPDGLYSPILMALSLGALGHSLWRARRAPLAERRRVRLLLFGIALGIVPITLVVTAQGLIPSLYQWSISSPSAWVLQLIVYPPLLAMPLVAAYAVYSRGALDVRLVVRAALRYALARHSVAVLAAFPFIGFGILLYRNREAQIGDLIGSGASAPLLAAAVLGLVAMKVRVPILEAVDRRFFRERYDARQILGRLIQASHRTSSLAELSNRLEREIEQALHIRSFALLVLDPERRQFTAIQNTVRSLPLSAELVQLVERGDQALPIDLEGRRPHPAGLPETDRDWLLDSGAALLVPVRAREAGLLAIFCLGSRLGDLPFTREDASLLSDIGSAVGVTLENQILRFHSGQSEPSSLIEWTGSGGADGAAHECRDCGRVVWATESRCDRCDGEVREAAVPRLLGNKFRIEERIGQGGMGVVYRATDLALDRSVAVKALPKVATRYAARLRQEARAMAAVSHPSLAPIYGAESWNGQPLLIVEYLPGGTLADRLREGPLTVESALSITSALAEGVVVLHAQGILHRDIKPSNVGLTATGEPKLLDFGLARLSETSHMSDPYAASFGGPAVAIEDDAAIDATSTRSGVVGTTLYLSPEALSGARPDPRFDVWGLSVLLYEGLTGRNPFWHGSLAGAMARILSVEPRELQEELPGCPASLAALMSRCLHADPGQRPGSASELRQLLGAVAEEQVTTARG